MTVYYSKPLCLCGSKYLYGGFMKKLRIGVLVSGRGSNLQAIIDAIQTGALSAVVAVVISDTPGVGAIKKAENYRIPFVVIERNQYEGRAAFEAAIVQAVEDHQAEVLALAGFMRILSGGFISRFPQRIVNIHPALLPAFPGLDAQAQALAYGVKIAGCTVHFVDEGTDTGPIILQEAVPIWENDTEETLAQRILAAEHKTYPRALQLLAEGRLAIEGRRVRIVGNSGDEGSEGP
jgi:phosphoribosylglycinamide formyltransferase 1